jgi:hypothetical protein
VTRAHAKLQAPVAQQVQCRGGSGQERGRWACAWRVPNLTS